MKKFLFLCFAATLLPSITFAKDAGYYNLIESKTVLNLSESAEKEVEQDRIRATLRIQKEARENYTVQNTINEGMQEAVSIAKKYDKVKISTGRYNIKERYNSKMRTNDGWKGSQSLILDSAEKEDILELVQKLQTLGFNMSGMNYYLSRDKAGSYRTELINEAIKRVQNRAASVAKQLGAKHWHIGSVDVSGGNRPSPVRHHTGSMEMVMSDSKSIAAPVVEGTEERVSVNIRVAVILDMRD